MVRLRQCCNLFLADCTFRFLIACLRFLLTDDQLRNTMMSRDSQTCPKVQTTLSVEVADHLLLSIRESCYVPWWFFTNVQKTFDMLWWHWFGVLGDTVIIFGYDVCHFIIHHSFIKEYTKYLIMTLKVWFTQRWKICY